MDCMLKIIFIFRSLNPFLFINLAQIYFVNRNYFLHFLGGRVKPCFGHGSYIEKLIAIAYYIDSLRRNVENVLSRVILARSNTSKG